MAASYFSFRDLRGGDHIPQLWWRGRQRFDWTWKCLREYPADGRHIVPGANAAISRECERSFERFRELGCDRSARADRQRRDHHTIGAVYSAGNFALAGQRDGHGDQQR